jgi:hypothetical protein
MQFAIEITVSIRFEERTIIMSELELPIPANQRYPDMCLQIYRTSKSTYYYIFHDAMDTNATLTDAKC